MLQYTPLASDEDLVNQLNIEKRPAVGNSLLATTDILQVRADVTVNSNPDDAETGRSAVGVHSGAAYCSEDWFMAGSQETAGVFAQEQASAHAKYEQAPEVDLFSYIISNPMYDCSAILSILDKADDGQEFSVSRSLADTGGHGIHSLLEDDIDGLLPSSTVSQTPVPDALNYQVPQAACTTDHSILLSASTAAPVRPISVTTDWKSLPAENSSVPLSCVSALRSDEQSGGYDVPYRSLPGTLPDRSAIQFPSTFLRYGTGEALQSVSQRQTAGSGLLQVVSAEPAPVKCQLPTTLVANACLMPSAAQVPYSLVSVCSPVGQITGTMGGLCIDNNSTGTVGGVPIDHNGPYPLLRTILTAEATVYQPAARDQKKITADQVI